MLLRYVIAMGSRWTETEDTAVRLAAELDWEHGGRHLAERLGRTESAVRQRASRLRAVQLEGDVDGPGARASLAARRAHGDPNAVAIRHGCRRWNSRCDPRWPQGPIIASYVNPRFASRQNAKKPRIPPVLSAKVNG